MRRESIENTYDKHLARLVHIEGSSVQTTYRLTAMPLVNGSEKEQASTLPQRQF